MRSNVPRHSGWGGCGTLCVCGLFECEAKVFQDAVAVQEAGHVCVGGVFKFAFVFAGQEGVYDFTLGFCEVGVLVALVGLPVFEKGCLVVGVLFEKGVQGVVFEAVHA